MAYVLIRALFAALLVTAPALAQDEGKQEPIGENPRSENPSDSPAEPGPNAPPASSVTQPEGLPGMTPEAEGDLAKAIKNFPKEGDLFDEYRDVAKDLRCPTCTGLSVLESEAKFSEQIKDIVKEQVQAGKSKGDILKYFTERYGPWILRAPPTEGFNVVAWVFPIVLLVAGPPLIWFFVWRKRRVVSSMGVRTVEAIVEEMNGHIEQLRGSVGRRS